MEIQLAQKHIRSRRLWKRQKNTPLDACNPNPIQAKVTHWGQSGVGRVEVSPQR